MDAAFLALVVIVVGRAGVRLHQRLPRRGQRDRGRGLDQGADAARGALALAAVMNLVGALISTKVAATVGERDHRRRRPAPAGCRSSSPRSIGAIAWNLITWYFGLPSSSSHALIGGLVGAALAAAESVQWSGILDKVVIPMVLSPLIGFGLGYLFMLAILWAFRRAQRAQGQPRLPATRRSSAPPTMAFGHGTQDAQKTMGIITLALVTVGRARHLRRPAVGHPRLGAGDQRRHVLRRLPHHAHARPADHPARPRPAASPRRRSPRGVMIATATVFAVPVSTTHIITTSIMGVGATRRLSAVRWGVAGNIVARLGRHPAGRRRGRRAWPTSSPTPSSAERRDDRRAASGSRSRSARPAGRWLVPSPCSRRAWRSSTPPPSRSRCPSIGRELGAVAVRAAVDRHRLHAHAGLADPARRLARRPVRPPQGVRHRRRAGSPAPRWSAGSPRTPGSSSPPAPCRASAARCSPRAAWRSSRPRSGTRTAPARSACGRRWRASPG